MGVSWDFIVNRGNDIGGNLLRAAVFVMFSSWVYSFAAKKRMYISVATIEYKDEDETFNRVVRIVGFLVGLIGMGWYLLRGFF